MSNRPRQPYFDEDPAYRVRKPVGPPPLESESEIEEAIQDQDMEEGDYLQDPEAPYDFNQAMEMAENYLASQGMPPEIDPKKHRQNQRQEKIRDLSERPGTSAEGEAAKKKLKRPEDLPNFLQSAEMGEIYSRDKELYGEFDRLVEEANNSSGRDKAALLQRAGRIRKQIETGVDPMTIGELGYKVAETLLPDPRNPVEMGEFALDAYLAVQSGGVLPAAKILAKKTIGKKLFREVWERGAKILAGGKYGDELVDAGTGMTMRMDEVPTTRYEMTSSGGGLSRGFSHVPPNPSEIYKVNQKLLNSSLLGPGQKFNHAAFKALLESDRGRTISILFQTTPHAKIPNWAAHRKGLVDVFEGLYGDVMSKLKISRSDIDIDHLFTLQQSMPIYDNVAYGSDLWNSLQRTMLHRKYQPGNTIANLNALDPGTHKVKTAFFNKLHGKNGERFFTRKRMKAIQNNPEERMKLLNKYLDEQDKGRKILENGQKVWETLYKPGTIMPDDLVEALADIPLDEFSHPTLKGIIKEIVEDEAARYALKVSQGQEALLKAIRTGKTPRVTKKNKLPTQKQIDKAIKDAGTSYQPTLDPTDPSLNP